MNKKANASAKSKEVQRHPQADTQLPHICFCPNAQKNHLRSMTDFFSGQILQGVKSLGVLFPAACGVKCMSERIYT